MAGLRGVPVPGRAQHPFSGSVFQIAPAKLGVNLRDDGRLMKCPAAGVLVHNDIDFDVRLIFPTNGTTFVFQPATGSGNGGLGSVHPAQGLDVRWGIRCRGNDQNCCGNVDLDAYVNGVLVAGRGAVVAGPFESVWDRPVHHVPSAGVFEVCSRSEALLELGAWPIEWPRGESPLRAGANDLEIRIAARSMPFFVLSVDRATFTVDLTH
mmetsp:Transcript_19520/g.54375  ORF Transcript_19520/g.54375 Transcript_19520/m.54375 type:complete len:209 (-) Transcript_19520:500-1126(-)